MYPILLDFGQIKIYTYGVFLALAFILATDYVSRVSDELKVPPKDIIDQIIWLLIAGLLGTRIVYIIQNIGEYIEEPIKILKIWEGGLAWYGGVIFGIISVYIWSKKNKREFLRILDLVALGVILGLAIGRWGCFSAGCCYGKPTDFFTSVIFKNPKTLAIQGVPIHPTQIYEALGMFFAFLLARGIMVGISGTKKIFELKTDIFIALELILLRFYYLWYSKGISFPSITDLWFIPAFILITYLTKYVGVKIGEGKNYFPGLIVGFYFISYGALRFFLEFIRDPSGLSGFIVDKVITVNHIVSAILFLFGMYILLFRSAKTEGK